MKNIYAFIIILLAFTTTASAQVSEQEFQALKALYNATGGDNWTNRTGWENINTTATKDDVTTAWNGIREIESGHIIDIYFYNNNLNGTLPSEIGSLQWMTAFSVGKNKLSGTIPSEIGQLLALEAIDFFWNNLSGPLPAEFQNLINLKSIEFTLNPLNCDFPSSILSKLTSLKSISAAECGLTGTFGNLFDDLIELEIINATYNRISGEIPASINRLKNLKTIEINRNQLTGNLPSLDSSLNSINSLGLSQNQFSGELPISYSNFKSLRNFDISSNNLSGNIPSELFNNPLTNFGIGGNYFSFEGIEPVLSKINAVKNKYYDINKYFPLTENTLSVNAGDPFILNATNYSVYGLGGNNNRYKWFCNNVEVYSGNSPIYSVASSTAANAGTYRFEVTNTVVTGITLKSENITVSIIGGNEVPTDILLSSDNVDENYTGEVATITALDPDASDTHTFTLASGNGTNDKDNGKFKISGNQLILNSWVNYETTPSLSVLITVNDGNGGIFTKAFVISVNDIDEVPSWNMSSTSTTIDENLANGSTVFTLNATDPEGKVLVFSINQGNDYGAFEIIGNKLVIANSDKLDYNIQSSHELRIVASDGVQSSSITLTVRLNKINRLPVIADAVFTIDENATVGSIVGTIEASDPDGEAITLSILTGNDAGAFHLNGNNLVVANSAPLNFRTTPQFVLSVNVSDGASNVQATITVKLNQVYFFTGNHLLTFLVPGLTAPAQIDTINRTVTAVVKDVDLSALPVTFTLSEGASTTIASGSAFNFSAGPQTMQVTSEAGTAQTWTISVTLQVGTDQFANQVWRIYPNPASHILLVEGVEPGSIVELINANGKIVRTETISNLNTSISLSGIEPGLYLFKLNNGDQSGTNKLIIK